jgi:purine-binding chemotaxis protein CheW
MTKAEASKENWARELVAFRVGDQEFCVDIMSVREIRGWTPATAIPHAPGYVRGVINLRGTVLPIIDLAHRFGLPQTQPTDRHAIIVSQIGEQLAGLLVDAVSDILSTNDGSIQPTPEVASSLARSFVRGVLVLDGRMISIITLENILPPREREAA